MISRNWSISAVGAPIGLGHDVLSGGFGMFVAPAVQGFFQIGNANGFGDVFVHTRLDALFAVSLHCALAVIAMTCRLSGRGHSFLISREASRRVVHLRHLHVHQDKVIAPWRRNAIQSFKAVGDHIATVSKAFLIILSATFFD